MVTNGLWPETEAPPAEVRGSRPPRDEFWLTATLLVNGGDDKVVGSRSTRVFVDAARLRAGDPGTTRLVTA